MKNYKYKEKTLHFKFADLREDSDLKQEEIADMLNVKRSRYSMWEIGERDFPIEIVNKLANIYKVNFDYLFDLSSTKYKKLKENINCNLLAQRLKELRKEHKLSQKDLGKEIGLSQKAISYYESGKIIPPYKNLILFAQYFKVSMDYLVGKTDNKNII